MVSLVESVAAHACTNMNRETNVSGTVFIGFNRFLSYVINVFEYLFSACSDQFLFGCCFGCGSNRNWSILDSKPWKVMLGCNRRSRPHMSKWFP